MGNYDSVTLVKPAFERGKLTFLPAMLFGYSKGRPWQAHAGWSQSAGLNHTGKALSSHEHPQSDLSILPMGGPVLDSLYFTSVLATGA